MKALTLVALGVRFAGSLAIIGFLMALTALRFHLVESFDFTTVFDCCLLATTWAIVMSMTGRALGLGKAGD
jgi:hypothetical protein